MKMKIANDDHSDYAKLVFDFLFAVSERDEKTMKELRKKIVNTELKSEQEKKYFREFIASHFDDDDELGIFQKNLDSL